MGKSESYNQNKWDNGETRRGCHKKGIKGNVKVVTCEKEIDGKTLKEGNRMLSMKELIQDLVLEERNMESNVDPTERLGLRGYYFSR